MSITTSSRSEETVRADLAAACRLAALAGWDDTAYSHLSAAVPGEPGRYLINDLGLAFEEVRACNPYPNGLAMAWRGCRAA
ncbi:MAG: class II aldolase/adducin family protein [Burkholderiaceae bacterium]|nr:class II aldolase/adducin family protein [Burkholderiaceae bacterium]